MADKISVLIQSILEAPTQENINKVKNQIQSAIGNVTSKSGSKGIKLLNPEEIDIYIKKLQNEIQRIQFRTPKVFDNEAVKKELNNLNIEFDKLRNGETTTKKVSLQMDNLKTQIVGASSALKNVNKDGYSFTQMLELATKKIAIWGLSTSFVYGTWRQIKQGISYISELDNSLNEIRIVTNKTQQEVNNLALSYNKLAKEMSVTTKEVASTAADLFRQGLNDNQVEERMKAIIQYAKISSISLDESNKIITATANATGESVQKIIDIFAYLGDATASGAEEIGEALQKVASTAENSGVSLEKAASWIATISSITRESASSIGNSLKTIISRYEQIKAKGFNEEDATQINDVTKALQAVGIAAVDAQGQLRPIAEVLDELGAKWDGLTKNEKAYVATTLAGTYQRNRLITLLDNYNDSLKNYEAALNSAGTAEQKFAIYQESTQAKLDKLRATIEDLYGNFISSDFLKGAIDSFTGFLNIIDRTSAELGGFGTILMFLTTGVLIKFTASLFSAAKGAGIIETALVALQLGVKGVSTALLRLLTNPITWLIAAITAIPVGIMVWANHQQKLKEQIEATTKAQITFNQALDEFNSSLDPKKIDDVAQSLERLKESTNYDENVKKIQKLKEEIAQLESSNTTQSVGGYTYGVNDAAIAIKKKQLAELEEKIKSVTDAQEKYNKAQELAKALDYESVQNSSKQIATKLKEIESNKQLLNSYEKVYAKLTEGKALTQDEIELNNKLINDYPEYTRVLNDKTGALGVNLNALNANLNAQEALAVIELNSLKETANAEKLKTQNLIDETNKRVKAIGEEINALEAMNQAYLTYINIAGEEDTNTLRDKKLYMVNRQKISAAGQLLAKSQKELESLKLTANAWDTLSNLTVEDLKKGVSSSKYNPPASSSKSSKSTEIYTAEINQFQQLEDAVAKVNAELERNQALIDITENPDKNNLLSKRIELYKEEQVALQKLINARRNAIQQNISKLKSLGFDVSYDKTTDDLTIKNLERINQLKGKNTETTNELRKSTEKLIQTTQSLNDANRQASTQYIQLNKDIKDLKQQQEEYAQKLIESYQNYVVKKIEEEINAWEDAKKKAQESAQEKIDAIQSEIDRLQERNEQLKIEEEQQERLIEIAKQKEMLENVKKQKNVRIYQNGQWVWVADPNKVKEETDKLKDLQDDYAKWEAKNARQAKIQRLQNQIKQIQTDLKTTENYYDNKIKLGQEFLEKYKKQWEEEKEEVTSYEALIQGLSGIEQSVYETRLQQLNDFVTAWNALVSSMMTPSAVGGSVNVEVSSSTTSSDGSYADGGIVNYTGLATVHGSPNAVETVFNAEQGKKLYDFVKNLPNNMNFLNVRLPQLNIPLFKNNAASQATENHYHFENLNIQANDPSEMFRKLNMLIEQYT